MKFWIVEEHGWGVAFSVVRATTAADAIRLSAGEGRGEATELADGEIEAVVWSYEYSPDSRRAE